MQYEELLNNQEVVSVLNAMKYETVKRMYLKNILINISTGSQLLYTLKYLTDKEKNMYVTLIAMSWRPT